MPFLFFNRFNLFCEHPTTFELKRVDLFELPSFCFPSVVLRFSVLLQCPISHKVYYKRWGWRVGGGCFPAIVRFFSALIQYLCHNCFSLLPLTDYVILVESIHSYGRPGLHI